MAEAAEEDPYAACLGSADVDPSTALTCRTGALEAYNSKDFNAVERSRAANVLPVEGANVSIGSIGVDGLLSSGPITPSLTASASASVRALARHGPPRASL